MGCSCCDKLLEQSEIKFNKLLKRWDYCGTCKTISKEILYDIELLNDNFLLDNSINPMYNIGVEEDDTHR